MCDIIKQSHFNCVDPYRLPCMIGRFNCDITKRFHDRQQILSPSLGLKIETAFSGLRPPLPGLLTDLTDDLLRLVGVSRSYNGLVSVDSKTEI